MARECPRCGEVLMGAVNRCWKCGLDLRAATQSTTPRTSATAHEPLIVAELANETDTGPPSTHPSPAPPISPVVAPQTPGAVEYFIDGSIRRRGSPFAPGAILLPPSSAPSFGRVAPKTQISLQQSYASNGGAIAAIVLGVFGLIIAPLRFEGAIVGLVGLTMGLWGLYSRRRGWALFGLILCCLAIGIGCYTGAFWLFRAVNNSTRWEY
ncbi:hypothetical protein ETAA8_49550 [Anatilimnocola aggregata]|uniref:DUF4190 domain-containing protein n=1 Tax=Anatilimnocola aggregata TaxID=2528021 RepID=A0A517YHX4_9BACT|nr:hypothetical protein [Anatilimnocola aggregata]QDU29840.1 hypothetical protein ETAA8_49550 [Anatilimnocola aggregata]